MKKRIFTKQQQKEFSEFVVRAMEKSKLTNTEIAKRIGVTKGAIHHASSPKNFESSRYNGSRINVLWALGYKIKEKIEVIE